MSSQSCAPSLAPGGREADPSSVGIMDGAFFVGRSELLAWVNSSLGLSLSRVEQCASGCVYLQILDALLGPKSRVPMQKVRWGARHEYEFIHNYKLLQAAFDAHDIHKHIEVNKLVKARHQDNLEFLQWIKAFYDRQAPIYQTDTPYNAFERRKVRLRDTQRQTDTQTCCLFLNATNKAAETTPSPAAGGWRLLLFAWVYRRAVLVFFPHLSLIYLSVCLTFLLYYCIYALLLLLFAGVWLSWASALSPLGPQ